MSKYCPPNTSAQLVLSWLQRCRESQFAHYEMASLYSKKNGSLGIPVIAINALVSASIFATFLESDNSYIRIIALGLSLVAIVLSALHTYLKFSDKAESHRVAGAEYAAARRKLEILHTAGVVSASVLQETEKVISELALKSPNISAIQFAKIMKGFAD